MTGEESGAEAGTAGVGLGWKPIVVVIIVIAAAIGGIFTVNKLTGPNLEPNEISAALVIDYGNGTVEWYNVTTVNNSVPGLLDAAIGAGNYDMSRQTNGVYFFMNINGYGELQQTGYAVNASVPPGGFKAWKYYLDGELAPNTTAAFEMKDKFALIQNGQTVKLAWEAPPYTSGIFTDTGISITVKINYGNGTVVSDTVITDNYTALGALEAFVGFENLDITDYSWGVLVNGINDIKTGVDVEGISDSSNYYWMWYINDVWATVGADAYVLQHGDVMEWRFEESQWR